MKYYLIVITKENATTETFENFAYDNEKDAVSAFYAQMHAKLAYDIDRVYVQIMTGEGIVLKKDVYRKPEEV